MVIFMLKIGILQPLGGDDCVELVMAQIGTDGHPLQPGFGGGDGQRGFVERDVKRHSRAVLPFHECVFLHHLVGQHGDLVARHVHRGQARPPKQVDGAARLMARPGAAMWMPSSTVPLPRPCTDSASSISVVAESSMENAWAPDRGNSSVMSGASSLAKPGALGKILQQETPPVELVR
jgi:hypothetical protein